MIFIFGFRKDLVIFIFCCSIDLDKIKCIVDRLLNDHRIS
jgi:hypothetical protein